MKKLQFKTCSLLFRFQVSQNKKKPFSSDFRQGREFDFSDGDDDELDGEPKLAGADAGQIAAEADAD